MKRMGFENKSIRAGTKTAEHFDALIYVFEISSNESELSYPGHQGTCARIDIAQVLEYQEPAPFGQPFVRCLFKPVGRPLG